MQISLQTQTQTKEKIKKNKYRAYRYAIILKVLLIEFVTNDSNLHELCVRHTSVDALFEQ